MPNIILFVHKYANSERLVGSRVIFLLRHFNPVLIHRIGLLESLKHVFQAECPTDWPYEVMVEGRGEMMLLKCSRW